MSDTPRTNRIRKMLRMSREVVRPREDQLALLEGAENGIEDLERELAAVTDVLQRHGFVRCDIPACNCGSWHPRYGYPERMQEIKDALADAGHELDNGNGNLPLNALKQLIAERDELKHEVAFRRDDSVALANARERIRSLEMDLDEKQRPLDAEMARLNENLIAANDAALLAAMERDRFRAELEKVNNEFGSQTAEWPDAWRRIADLKQSNGEQWRELERMRPVVEAALRWTQAYLTGEDPMLEEAVNAYKFQTQEPPHGHD